MSQVFAIEKLFLKDLSFESPLGADAFTQDFKPSINIDLNTHNRVLDETMVQVSLRITATATDGDTTLFIAEVEQAGIFRCEGMDADERKSVMGMICPNILFPYIREALDSVITKGGFPPLQLAPINFEALYQDIQEKDAEQPTQH